MQLVQFRPIGGVLATITKPGGGTVAGSRKEVQLSCQKERYQAADGRDPIQIRECLDGPDSRGYLVDGVSGAMWEISVRGAGCDDTRLSRGSAVSWRLGLAQIRLTSSKSGAAPPQCDFQRRPPEPPEAVRSHREGGLVSGIAKALSRMLWVVHRMSISFRSYHFHSSTKSAEGTARVDVASPVFNGTRRGPRYAGSSANQILLR